MRIESSQTKKSVTWPLPFPRVSQASRRPAPHFVQIFSVVIFGRAVYCTDEPESTPRTGLEPSPRSLFENPNSRTYGTQAMRRASHQRAQLAQVAQLAPVATRRRLTSTGRANLRHRTLGQLPGQFEDTSRGHFTDTRTTSSRARRATFPAKYANYSPAEQAAICPPQRDRAPTDTFKSRQRYRTLYQPFRKRRLSRSVIDVVLGPIRATCRRTPAVAVFRPDAHVTHIGLLRVIPAHGGAG